MTVLSVSDARIWFRSNRGLLARLVSQPEYLRAVDGVSFEIGQGEILGLAGASGSGKSSLAFGIMGHHPLRSGSIRIGGQEVTRLRGGAALRELRRTVQLIFQDPYQSLNPLFDIGRIVSEPLHIQGGTRPADITDKVLHALSLAGLDPARSYLSRYPHELSGGQRQRVAIARAVVVEPKLLIADEPTSMLDVSVRAGILKLLSGIAATRQVAILYISHDLATMRQICGRIAVMHRGRIVEVGPTAEIIERPRDPYTKSLIAAVPALAGLWPSPSLPAD